LASKVTLPKWLQENQDLVKDSDKAYQELMDNINTILTCGTTNHLKILNNS